MVPAAQQLLRFAAELTTSHDAAKTARIVAEKAADLVGATSAAVYLCSADDAGDPRLAGVAGAAALRRLPTAPALVVRALAAKAPCRGKDAELLELEAVEPGRAFVATPLLVGGEALGVLLAGLDDDGREADDLGLLSGLAELAAASLATARRLELTFEEARSDTLTGLGNHRAFHEHLEHLLRAGLEEGGEIALVLIDLDDFKRINDEAGHLAGDEVLRAVSAAMTRLLRDGERAFRLGGDEFVIVVRGSSEAGAGVGERLRAALAEAPELPMLSAGVGSFPADARTKDALLHKADVALYAAKHAGKNTVVSGADLQGAAGRARAEVSRESLRERMSVEAVRSVVFADFASVRDAVRVLAHETDRQGVLESSARALPALLGATACTISQLQEELLREVASYWPPPFDTGPTFSEYAYLLDDYPLTREVMDTATPRAVSLSDAVVDESEAFVLDELRMHAVLMLPLSIGGRVWGLVEIHDAAPRRFSEKDASLAELVVGETGARLTQFDHAEAVGRLYRETLASLANALEAKDGPTSAHAQEVVDLSVEVARRLGVAGEQLRAIELGALLHDVGKIRVPESILKKPDPLTPEEWAVMRRHTEAGEAILAPISSLRDVLPIVRSSHERWDGAGYPDGLRGNAIPLGARIVSVSDAYRAMVEPRPYRRPLEAEEAVRELRDHAGTQFDPACVEAILHVLGEREVEPVLKLHRPGDNPPDTRAA